MPTASEKNSWSCWGVSANAIVDSGESIVFDGTISDIDSSDDFGDWHAQIAFQLDTQNESILSLSTDSGLTLLQKDMIRGAYARGEEAGLFTLFFTANFKRSCNFGQMQQWGETGKSYLPSKTDKYALRFYAVVVWSSLYVRSVWDNVSGNTLPTTPPDRYTATFPDLRTPLCSTLRLPNVHVTAGSHTALWVAMMDHQTRVMPYPSGRRLIVCDNFYTRHFLASALLRFTDGETCLLGTVRLNLGDRWNKVELAKAMERVEQTERDSWKLVAAVEPISGWQVQQEQRNKQQLRLPKRSRTSYVGPVSIVNKAGFVVFKDRKVVVFYTKDLRDTVSTVRYSAQVGTLLLAATTSVR
ncbi:unnamed protein product [Phytophthora fragariaefolia]|uniref:Unnamed protein product n=1 Tax=Phytophthora fragariaefolia TaxID=1490495 RepID=A0A9W6XKB7_9STRA|nr:unnamed protein product [Phytophthora fragariaefolia]